MRRVIVLGLVLGLMLLGSAMVSIAQEAPVLEKIWAPAEFNAGSLVKIYIKASDPRGDMRWLYVTASRATALSPQGAVPVRLKKGLRKEVNGYVWWDSRLAAEKSGTAKVEIFVEDWKGNESETKSLTIKMVAKGAKAEAVPADFKEVDLGPIMIDPTIYKPMP